jgi:hypothetical protein
MVMNQVLYYIVPSASPNPHEILMLSNLTKLLVRTEARSSHNTVTNIGPNVQRLISWVTGIDVSGSV